MQKIHWSSYSSTFHSELSRPLREWLLYPGSFMKHLESIGVYDSEIQVIKQSWGLPTAEEAVLLNIQPRQFVLIREVLIGKKNKSWMFARTVFPRETLTGKEQLLARLKNRALGSILFKNKSTKRSPFEITEFAPDSQMYLYIKQFIRLPKKFLWARRSLFFIKHKTLLLTEIFLPDMQTLIEKTS